jgi:hypothetical protein
MFFPMSSDTMLSWKAQGLNAQARREVVAELVSQVCVSLLCIQQSKLPVVDDAMVILMLGSSYVYHFVPASGTRGGILVGWHSDMWTVCLPHHTPHSIS